MGSPLHGSGGQTGVLRARRGPERSHPAPSSSPARQPGAAAQPDSGKEAAMPLMPALPVRGRADRGVCECACVCVLRVGSAFEICPWSFLLGGS